MIFEIIFERNNEAIIENQRINLKEVQRHDTNFDITLIDSQGEGS